MDPITLGVLSLGVLTLLLVSGVRIAFATAICGFAGLWILRGYDAAAYLAASSVYGHLVNYNLLVLPLFILMGFFA
ncbi:MAG: TRAP transporter large permease, partial [Hyphomicrobiaceae bacterium]|nr:TRAP transporter large permease [Hyphomicrobiaceae bacterium]